MFELYFTRGGDPSNQEALVAVATAVGLDPADARRIVVRPIRRRCAEGREALAVAIGVARPHLSAMRHRPVSRPRGPPPLPDAQLVADIRVIFADLPTCGYRRVHALLRRQAEKTRREAPSPKRVYRLMKVHGLLRRDGERRAERRHDGRVAVDLRNTAGAPTGWRSPAAMARRCVWHSRSTAATVRRWDMSQRWAASLRAGEPSSRTDRVAHR